MNRDEFLTKIAMDMVEWPTYLDGKDWSERLSSSWISVGKGEWLQRRAELINCPPDSEAPSWAKWKAQIDSGVWYWFAEKPFVSLSGMITQASVEWAASGEIPAGHRWQDTLTEVNTMTTTAHEDQYAPDVSDPEEDKRWDEHKAQLDRAKAEKVKGWQPGVGDRVLVDIPGVLKTRAEVVAYHLERPIVWTHSHMEYRPVAVDYLSPAPTDRERWIEAAHSVSALIDDNDFVRKVLGEVYDAGLAKLPGANHETP